jgi:hypothetical protein
MFLLGFFAPVSHLVYFCETPVLQQIFIYREPMSIQKGILVQDLLGLICRALGVTGLSLGSSQLTETQLLRDLIPTVHSSFYTILTSMTEM